MTYTQQQLKEAKYRDLENLSDQSKYLHDHGTFICTCDECVILRKWIMNTLKRIREDLDNNDYRRI